MGPKKGKRRNKNDDDQQFPDQDKIVSKWAQALQQTQKNDQQPDAEQLYTKPTKAIFQFDFSNQRALDLKQQPIKPQRDKLADLTPQQLQQLKRIKEQARIDKQAKNQIKKEKNKERKKQIEAQKAVETAQKQKQEQQLKKVQQQIKKTKKSQGSPWIIPAGLLIFLIVMFFLQYKKQIHEKLSKFQNQGQNYYQILQADQGNTDRDLKNKYKQLVMKYHPDRNPDCANCKQKFDKIMKAWEVLGDPSKRKQYDQNNGHISQLKSASTTLTPHNYHYLVQQSKGLWFIQVFDSTNSYSQYFSQFWEEMVNNYGDIVKFGRIDIWHQPQMNSYLPYKFQVFPAVYFLNHGYSEICTFNFERPLQGLKKCLQQAYSKVTPQIVKQMQQTQKNGKIPVYLDGKLRANIRIKAYNEMFSQYFNFYYIQKQINNQKSQRQATVVFNNIKNEFNFNENTKKVFTNYALFLQSFIIQQISMCSFLHQCQQQKCALIINQTKINTIKKQFPLKPNKDGQRYPLYLLKDEKQQFNKQINLIKQSYQHFQIGMFQGGRIDLGYAHQAHLLNVQQGERIELQCKYYTWKDMLKIYYNKIYSFFDGKENSNQ